MYARNLMDSNAMESFDEEFEADESQDDGETLGEVHQSLQKNFSPAG